MAEFTQTLKGAESMSDEVIAGEVEQEQVTTSETEQATDQVRVEQDQTQSETTEQKPNKTAKRISRLVANIHHKDSKLAQMEAELATLKAEREKKVEPVKPVGLPKDDLRFDNPDEYERQLREYNASIAREEWQKLQSQQQQEQQRATAEAERQKQQEKYSGIVESYIESGLNSGISEDQMAANESILSNAALDKGLVERLYSDQNGAQMVDYLAANPDKLGELKGMNPYEAGAFITTQLKPAALSIKPQQTNAPDPLGYSRGGGTPPADEWDSLAPGATFE